MARTLCFTLLGYLSGGVLYARLFARLFGKENALLESSDANPGTFNAFEQVGPLCGMLTLLCDIMKGFLPVYLYLCGSAGCASPGLAFVMAAPVLGHAFPLFWHFEGGKGIAVSFGCMLALLPEWIPLVVLASFFIFFSVIMKINPHFYRTLVTYLFSAVLICVFEGFNGIGLGFLMISMVVCLRLHLSEEERGRLKVGLLWMH